MVHNKVQCCVFLFIMNCSFNPRRIYSAALIHSNTVYCFCVFMYKLGVMEKPVFRKMLVWHFYYYLTLLYSSILPHFSEIWHVIILYLNNIKNCDELSLYIVVHSDRFQHPAVNSIIRELKLMHQYY